MVRQKGSPRVKITTQIPIECFEWVKNNKLVYSQLLESAINIHKNAVEDGIKEDYHLYLKNRINNMSMRLNKLSEFLAKNNLYDKYLEENGEK